MTQPSRPAGPDQTPSTASVSGDLRAIDTTALDHLLAIRQAQTRLSELRQRAEERKAGVAEAVARRVLDDYRARAASLETEARPLIATVAAGHQAILGLHQRVTAARDRAALDKEELEFRHGIGELTDAELADRVGGATQILDACQADLASIDTARARFEQALGSDLPAVSPPVVSPDVTAPPPAPAAPAASAPVPRAPAATPAVEPPRPAPAADAHATMIRDATAMFAPDLGLIAPDLDALYAQAMAQRPGGAPASSAPASAASASAASAAASPPSPPSPPSASSSQSSSSSSSSPAAPAGSAAARAAQVAARSASVGGEATVALSELPFAAARPATKRQPHPVTSSEAPTFMLPPAVLVLTPTVGSPVVHRLAALNTLGRAEDNQIQVTGPGVSRRHARIMATSVGFVIADLDSQNGTFVNGERITEHELVDGDRVLIGEVELIYRFGPHAT